MPTGGAPQALTRYDDGREQISSGRKYRGPGRRAARDGGRRRRARQLRSEHLRQARAQRDDLRLHLQLEEELADHYGTEAAVLTSSGINANVALLSTIGNPGDVLLVDAHAHASVHAGAAAGAAP